MTYLFFNVYWFLCILKPALLLHANNQSPDVIAYLPVDYTRSWMSLYTGLAVYNQVLKLTMYGLHAPKLGQKKSAAHGRVEVLQIVFWLSREYMQDLRLALSFGKLGFDSYSEIFHPIWQRI